MMKTKYKLLVKEGSYAEDSLIKLISIVFAPFQEVWALALIKYKSASDSEP